ncbi:MAG: DUF3052 domain-containing protein [Caulobacteraceae bacterium]|nr:DUF3052 domain-containing protein [Caulobacteraceae bacterium]
MRTVGYARKSLTSKLGVKPGDVILTIGAPSHYRALVAPLPDGAEVTDDVQGPAIVHAFARNRAALEAMATRVVRLPRPGGALWLFWPKKSSPLYEDLSENGVREVLLPTGWVDVKVCAVDAEWSGLKFLRRRG